MRATTEKGFLDTHTKTFYYLFSNGLPITQRLSICQSRMLAAGILKDSTPPDQFRELSLKDAEEKGYTIHYFYLTPLMKTLHAAQSSN